MVSYSAVRLSPIATTSAARAAVENKNAANSERCNIFMPETYGRIRVPPRKRRAPSRYRCTFQRVSGVRLMASLSTSKPQYSSKYATPSFVLIVSRRLRANSSMYSL